MPHPMTPAAGAGRRLWAVLSLLSGMAAVVLLVSVGVTRTLALVLVLLASVVVLFVALWLVLAHRGLARAAGVLLALGAVTVVIVALVRRDLVWAVLSFAGLAAVALAAGRAALAPSGSLPALEESAVPPAAHPFLIMNPRSGDGKADRFGLREKAEALGVEVAVLDGPEFVDVAELARAAISRGADLVGVAGGDGTQALVAAVAAEADVPMFVIPAGTRNHFALDLGIDRDDLAGSLDALQDGVELRVDLGDVGGRPFVNNVSFGAYAAIVERPDYRADKLRVTMRLLPELLTGGEGARLTAHADGQEISEPQALLVSNNAYGTGDLGGAGRRVHLDDGVLGVLAVHVSNARSAARLTRGERSGDITRTEAKQVVVDAAGASIPAGVDGESVMFTSPVRCIVRPGALRVRVPRQRPGFATEKRPVRFGDLMRLVAQGTA